HAAQLLLVAADEQEVRHEAVAIGELHPALLPDREQGAHQVLAVAHPSRRAVDDDPDPAFCHVAALLRRWPRARTLANGNRFPSVPVKHIGAAPGKRLSGGPARRPPMGRQDPAISGLPHRMPRRKASTSSLGEDVADDGARGEVARPSPAPDERHVQCPPLPPSPAAAPPSAGSRPCRSATVGSARWSGATPPGPASP